MEGFVFNLQKKKKKHLRSAIKCDKMRYACTCHHVFPSPSPNQNEVGVSKMFTGGREERRKKGKRKGGGRKEAGQQGYII